MNDRQHFTLSDVLQTLGFLKREELEQVKACVDEELRNCARRALLRPRDDNDNTAVPELEKVTKRHTHGKEEILATSSPLVVAVSAPTAASPIVKGRRLWFRMDSTTTLVASTSCSPETTAMTTAMTTRS
jgi:hypothetical protein